MHGIANKHHDLKQKAKNEMRRYITYTLFLTFFFGVFTTYERLLLNNLHAPFIPYGYSVIQALIMAKVILIGESIKLGERYSDRPLIIPVLYKTLVFCLLMMLLNILEHVITDCLIKKQSIEYVYEKYISRDLSLAFAKTVVMFFVFIFFFSVLETSRALGDNKLFNLFFKAR